MTSQAWKFFPVFLRVSCDTQYFYFFPIECLKECNLGTPRSRRRTGHRVQKGWECLWPLRIPLFPNLHIFTSLKALKTPFFGAFTGFLWRQSWETEPVTPDWQWLTFWKLHFPDQIKAPYWFIVLGWWFRGEEVTPQNMWNGHTSYFELRVFAHTQRAF